MPFSSENIRATSLTLGVVMLVTVSVASVVMLARTPNPPPTLYATVTGFPSMVVMQLLQHLRQLHSEREIRKTRHDLKNDLQPVRLAVEHTAALPGIDRDELRAMIRESVHEAMPTEVRAVVRAVVVEVCGELKQQIGGSATPEKAQPR